MYAQCPECLTIYELDPTTVAQAGGTVGCGHCGASFNTLRTLTDVLPEEPFDSLSIHGTSPAPPILMMAVVRQSSPQQALFPGDDDIPTVERSAEPEEAPLEEDEPLPAPSFARQRAQRMRPRHTGRWLAACLLLSLSLCAQLVWAERVPLTANASTRPWVQQACQWFGCSVPPVRDLAQLQLLSRDVHPHPSVSGALLISAAVRNNASFTQPYPVLSITLSDLDENRIAMRRFRPADYIANSTVRAAGMAPGATAALVFEVKDPGRNAVAFRFDFQ